MLKEPDFWENSENPCLKASRFIPLSTKILVTPIIDTCKKYSTGLDNNTKFQFQPCQAVNSSFATRHSKTLIIQYLLIFAQAKSEKRNKMKIKSWKGSEGTASMFLFSSSKKSIELKGTPVFRWILRKWSVLWDQLEKISCIPSNSYLTGPKKACWIWDNSLIAFFAYNQTSNS